MIAFLANRADVICAPDARHDFVDRWQKRKVDVGAKR